jgi:hypothetical protein
MNVPSRACVSQKYFVVIYAKVHIHQFLEEISVWVTGDTKELTSCLVHVLDPKTDLVKDIVSWISHRSKVKLSSEYVVL